MVCPFHQPLTSQGVDAPDLPPLSDPEFFQEVFLHDSSSKKSKFLPQYGDALLKAMTLDILTTELLGVENYQAATNIFPLAISNAFYEQIVLYYRLEKANPLDRGDKGQVRTHARGDLLEAYLAAIQKDVSRNGDGYREVQNWLSKVLALRLPRITAQKGMVVHSIGTEQKSFTTIWPPSSDLKTTTLSRASGGSLSPSEMAAIWRQDNGGTLGQQSIHSSRIIKSDSDGTSDDLNGFRQFLFDTMRQVVMQTYESGRWEILSFWKTLSDRFSQLQTALEGKSESMLLFYYRVKLPR